ncbi:MAG: 50S ribosomal protein L10 [Dehalococcoidia bacterium]
MPTQRKIETVETLRQHIERSVLTIAADFRGLRVPEMEELRRRLRAANVELKVVKNNLLRLAAEAAGKPDLMQVVEGPTALGFTSGDIIEAARTITEYARTAPGQFAVRGAFLDGQVLTADDLRDLVRLPPKPVLLAQVAGQLQSPLATLAGLLDSHLRELSLLLQSSLSQLPGLIDARAAQLESAQQ